MTTFAKRLEKELKAKKIRKGQLSIKANVSYCSIERWLKNGSYPRIEKLKEICECLDISADYLLGLSDEKERKYKA